MTRSQTIVAAAATAVTIPLALASALLVGGEHAAAPASIRTPVIGAIYPGYVSQEVKWDAQPDASGFKLFLNGVVIGLVPGKQVASLLAVQCGKQHRFNAQPFNNKGQAPLAPPLYFTAACP